MFTQTLFETIYMLPNEVALQSQPCIQENNDYCTLSIKILEKFPSAIETQIPPILHI